MISGAEQETAVTVFAFVVTFVSLLTWLVMLALEGSSRDRNYWLIFYILLGALLALYFMVGFGLILAKRDVNTAQYFRPMLSVLIFFLTGSGVFVYREREQGKVIQHQQALIKELSHETG